MSKYTTEVRYICEAAAGLEESVGFDGIDDVLEVAAPRVFNFSFPMWDESYRTALEIKILRYYYVREICCETVGLWKLMLQNRLNKIMPYYNKLYETTVLEFNPLYDVDLSTDKSGGSDSRKSGFGSDNEKEKNSSQDYGVVNREDKRTESSQTDGNDSNVNKYSDTPQGGITQMNVVDNMYLTNATLDNGTNHSESTGSSDNKGNSTSANKRDGERNNKRDHNYSEMVRNTDEYVEHISGSRGYTSYAKKILELRETIIDIDAMIIEELSDLFFSLWG